MRITRRDALRFAGAGALLAVAPNLASALGAFRPGDESLYPQDNSAPWPVLQGPTDDRSATFILLLPVGYPFSILVNDGTGGRRPASVVATTPMPHLGLATYEVAVTGLAPGRDYTLFLLNSEGAYFDRRIFRALDVHRVRPFRFAAASCMNDLFERHSITMWEAMAREECDFVILHGDTCYADQRMLEEGPLGIARRYSETRMALSWFRMERLTPTFAVWDDHDFGTNNGDRTFEYAGFTRDLFRQFWGSRETATWHKGLGVGSRLEAFGQRFFMLDGRSFRDPPETPDGRHWEPEQLAWLSRHMGSDRRPAFIINGNQYFGVNPLRESVEADQPGDLRRIMADLASSPAPVALISGDVHFSEIRAIDRAWLGYDSYEFTASSIHSAPNPGFVRQGNIVSERWHNFMTFDVDFAGGWDIRSRSILEGNRVSFDESFAIARH